MKNVLIAAVMLAAVAPAARAQSHDDHGGTTVVVQRKNTAEENDLVKIVQQATQDFHDVSNAMAKGYALMFGCVSGADYGAMGLHFVNGGLVFDGEVDATKPEIVLYEPLPNGRARITGADFLVLAADWDAKHPAPPQLNGQLFHHFEAPNRFGLPAFYTLHVWAWKDNPNGTFTNWNPDVSCDNFNPQTSVSSK